MVSTGPSFGGVDTHARMPDSDGRDAGARKRAAPARAPSSAGAQTATRPGRGARKDQDAKQGGVLSTCGAICSYIPKLLYSFFVDPELFVGPFVLFAALLQIAISAVVVTKVPYTEIDWTA